MRTASRALDSFLSCIYTLDATTPCQDLTDGQLLELYLDGRDGDAFATIVQRHGPMVFGICRRVLPDEQEAEDAFQATFIVLAKKASSVRNREHLSPDYS